MRWKAPRKIDNPAQFITPKENNFCVQRPSGMGGSDGDGDGVGVSVGDGDGVSAGDGDGDGDGDGVSAGVT